MRKQADWLLDSVVNYVVGLAIGGGLITALVAVLVDEFPVSVALLEGVGFAAGVALIRAGLVGERARQERQNDPRITLGMVTWENAQIRPAGPDEPVYRLTVQLTFSAVALPASFAACRLVTERGLLDCLSRRESALSGDWGLSPAGTQVGNIHPDMFKFPLRLEPHDSQTGYVHFLDSTMFPTPRELAAKGAALIVVANGLELEFPVSPVIA